jgi:hypothetical protein
VEFYTRDGQLIGDKDSLGQMISSITGIPLPALRGMPLAQFSADERLRWAANRNTRRIEDKAYSLLGLFNIFMPPNYGEGEHALARLEREIKKLGHPAQAPRMIVAIDFGRSFS